MPDDSLHINNKAVQQNTYDAIVIGSGISGGWAAREIPSLTYIALTAISADYAGSELKKMNL